MYVQSSPKPVPSPPPPTAPWPPSAAQVNGGPWGAVCGTFFGDYEATVACRQAGFEWGSKAHADSSWWEGGYVLSGLDCNDRYQDSLNTCTYNYDVTPWCYSSDGYIMSSGPAMLECHSACRAWGRCGGGRGRLFRASVLIPKCFLKDVRLACNPVLPCRCLMPHLTIAEADEDELSTGREAGSRTWRGAAGSVTKDHLPLIVVTHAMHCLKFGQKSRES